MTKKSILNSSIGRKYAMALSALFLLVFLLQHFLINFTSIISADVFNSISEFMGNNIIIQFGLQPVLIIGTVFHFVMGFILEINNKKARSTKYKSFKGGTNSSWMSRNMIWSGAAILAFLILHFIDFFIPELNHKYVEVLGPDSDRYYDHLVHHFENPFRVAAYCIAFILLAMHLLHGFQSAFQSVGVSHKKWTPLIKAVGKAYAIILPLGFIFIALFHHFAHH